MILWAGGLNLELELIRRVAGPWTNEIIYLAQARTVHNSALCICTCRQLVDAAVEKKKKGEHLAST